MSTATRTTDESVRISPFVTSLGVEVTKDDVNAAGQVKLRKLPELLGYTTDEGDFTIDNEGKGLWMVTFNADEEDYFEATGLQQARKAAAAYRIALRRLDRERADLEARSRGFESASDEVDFQIKGENLTKVAAKLVASANSKLGYGDLTWSQKVNGVVEAERALHWVARLWYLLGEGMEWKQALANVRSSAEQVAMQKARYIADHARTEDLCELQAAAKVADSELWGYGFSW